VPVQAEGVAQTFRLHELEAYAVRQTQRGPVLSKQTPDASAVKVARDPMDGQEWQDPLFEIPDGINADSVLQERRGFQDNVVGRLDGAPALQQLLKEIEAVSVPFLGVHHGGVE